MLRALCECLHIRGAIKSVFFEKSHTLKMICIRDKIKNDISFIINKKTLIHLPAGVLMKSWFLPHRLLRSRCSSMLCQLWWSRISANSLCERKTPVLPGFLSFPSKGRFGSSIVELVNDILFDPHLLVFHEREIHKPWLAIYFIKWENVLKSLVKIKNTR
jgi:hypothetical protein